VKWIYGIHKLQEDEQIISQLKIFLLYANSFSESEKAEFEELGGNIEIQNSIENTQFKKIIGA
jgi:hypothetical protein